MWLLEKLRANQGLELNITMLKFTGLWPATGNASKTYLNKLGVVFLFVLCVLIFTIMVPLGMLYSSDDVLDIAEGIGIGFGGMMAVAKYACFYFQSSSIKNLTFRIASLKLRSKMVKHRSEEGRNIADFTQKCINFLFTMSVIYIVFIEFGILSRQFSMFAIRKHFTRFWFFIDPYESPAYEIIFAVSTVAIFLHIVVPPVTDCFIAAIFVATIAQLQLLRLDMSRISEDAADIVRQRREKCEIEIKDIIFSVTQDEALKCEPAEQRVVAEEKVEVDNERKSLMGESAYRYQECVRIVRDVEEAFGPILLIMVTSTVVSLLAGIIFALSDPTASKGLMEVAEIEKHRLLHRNAVLSGGGLTLVVCLEYAFFCFLADMISDESEQVRDAVYDCDWFDATEGFKRSMRIIMSCCNQPLGITVAGFIPMTMETFIATINLAYSYYTTLNTAGV